MKTPYQRRLARPGWQLKRLELFNARGLKCELCGAKDRELHIHHLYYIDKAMPEDHPDDAFQVLCYVCHAFEEERKKVPSKESLTESMKDAYNNWANPEFTREQRTRHFSYAKMMEAEIIRLYGSL